MQKHPCVVATSLIPSDQIAQRIRLVLELESLVTAVQQVQKQVALADCLAVLATVVQRVQKQAALLAGLAGQLAVAGLALVEQQLGAVVVAGLVVEQQLGAVELVVELEPLAVAQQPLRHRARNWVAV
ncbi:MAG: hypothetical protein AAGA46_08065 [Cyanobacteria bacterium P01_F01_bin.13]